MTRTIQTTYRYRLTPTAEQVSWSQQFAGARRFVWNWGLSRKREHYQATGKNLTYNALCRELTALKRQPETTWLRAMHSQLLQQALRDLEHAFQAFFRRVRTGEPKKGFPRFKSKKTDPLRFRLPQHVRVEGSFVRVPKIGLVKAIVHRPITGVTKSATFKRESGGYWYITLVVEQSHPPHVERTVKTHVGVDMGLKSFGVLSNGETLANPRFYRTQMRKLARMQRALSRKQKNSRNRSKARRKVARLYQKVTHQRLDFLHKLSRDLVSRFDLISIEDLNVRGLARTKLSCDVRLSM
jgi:putative transposase